MWNTKTNAFVLLLLALFLVLASSIGIQHPDSESPPPEPPSETSEQIERNVEGHSSGKNIQVDEQIYEHGEEIPFDYKEYTKHVDKDKDGEVSFQEHEAFFKQTVLAHETDHQEWQQYIKDYYDHLDADRNGKLSVSEYISMFAPSQNQDEL